jgi:hypothetical protein
LLPHPSRKDLVGGAASGKTLDLHLCERIMAVSWCRILLGGFIFGAAHRQAGPVEGQGVRVEASVATMVGSSDVRDEALFEVIGSSPLCLWLCLGLFVAVKSKLQWRVLVSYDDW